MPQLPIEAEERIDIANPSDETLMLDNVPQPFPGLSVPTTLYFVCNSSTCSLENFGENHEFLM